MVLAQNATPQKTSLSSLEMLKKMLNLIKGDNMYILFKNARILTMENNDIFHGCLLVKDNKIEYVGKDQVFPFHIDKTIDCNGNLLMPGFKNAHAHTAMVFARSYADNLPLQEWLFDNIIPMEEKLTPEFVYELTKCGILEYLTSGITSCFDMYYYPESIAKASVDMGFRNVILSSSTNEDISIHRNRILQSKNNSLVTYKLGLHAEYTSSIEDIKRMSSLANELKIPMYLHVGETQKEVNDCIKRNGMRPIEFLDSLGVFNYGGGAYHSVYLSDNEIEICQRKHIDIITCPGSNLKLASGIAPINKYFNNGLRISIGTDGASSNNSLDIFKEMYLTSCLQKVINNDPSVMDGYDVLKFATVNSALTMGLNDCDILAKGKLADIIMIDLTKPSMQPINNIINNIVYSGSKDIVKMTMIDGKILYYDGKFNLPFSKEEIYSSTQKIADLLKKK